MPSFNLMKNLPKGTRDDKETKLWSTGHALFDFDRRTVTTQNLGASGEILATSQTSYRARRFRFFL